MAPALHGDKEGDGGEDSSSVKRGAGGMSGYNCIIYRQGGGQGSEKGNPLYIVHVKRRFWEGGFVSFLPEDNMAFYCL